jgi:hypothetical protein
MAIQTHTLASEDDRELFVTRAEHDVLIDIAPQWMAQMWPKFKAKWCLAGARVWQCTGSGLATKLNYIRSQAKAASERYEGFASDINLVRSGPIDP